MVSTIFVASSLFFIKEHNNEISFMTDLLAEIAYRCAERNHAWLQMLVRSYDHGLWTQLRTPHSSEGHRYTLYNVVLNTRLGKWLEVSTQGDKCGDNGGKTTKGTSCRRKATHAGRCAQHPPELFTVVHNAGDTVPSLTVDLGNDHDANNTTWLWDQVTLDTDTSTGLSVVDLKKATLIHTGATVLWDHLINSVVSDLGFRT